MKPIIILTFLLVTQFTKGDLPVHCLKHDIVGEWVVKASDLIPVTSGHEMKCGHDEPSRKETSWLAVSPYDLRKEYKLKLEASDVAVLDYEGKILNGNWTMVYDEGFSLQFEYLSFFAFSKYIRNPKNVGKEYSSQCYLTEPGWYNVKGKNLWGCYQAYKLGVDLKKESPSDNNSLNIVQPNIKNLRGMMSFISLVESSRMQLRLNSSFKMHTLYINFLEDINKSWTAGLHSQFSDKTIKELNSLAGIPRAKRMRFKEIDTVSEDTDVSMFPKSFDWKDKLKPAGTQGNCGSCYAFSTIRMIMARLKIIYNHDIDLSVQHALDCTIYNQGCNGGYPYLTMKYGNEFELIPEQCKRYTGQEGHCDNIQCDMASFPFIYKTIDYKYIGGSYGKCTIKGMMEEVYKNGPIVVSFEPDYNFMLYTKGVYHSIESQLNEKGFNMTRPKPEWEKVDHSVLLVGWGETDDGEKYWLIQNTWGPDWGEEGFFRIRRGTDEFGIESICEAANVSIISKFTGERFSISEAKDEIKSNKSIFTELK